MNERQKECFTRHVLMHGLFGLGLGVLASTYFVGLRNMWIGVVLIVIAIIADAMRK